MTHNDEQEQRGPLPPALRAHFEERLALLRKERPELFDADGHVLLADSNEEAAGARKGRKQGEETEEELKLRLLRAESGGVPLSVRLDVAVLVLVAGLLIGILYVEYNINVIAYAYDGLVASLDPGLPPGASPPPSSSSPPSRARSTLEQANIPQAVKERIRELNPHADL